MLMAPSAVENVIRPDSNGVMLKPSCSSSGSRNGSAPTPMRKMNPPSTLARKVARLNSEMSRSGAGVRRACRT